MAATRPPCIVCNTAEGKYKCPRCYLYSCSLSCSKEHRNSHPTPSVKSESESAVDISALPVGDVPAAPVSDVSSTQERPDVSKRSGIADMPEYKALLRKYPNLERLLWDIAVATDPPSDNGSAHGKHGAMPGSVKGGRKPNQPWTKDMGYENGVEALRRTREAPGDDRDALKEYCELVRQYSAKREYVAATKVRREVAQDDARAISNLLRAEETKNFDMS
ncbi:hypothetical protein F4818DRAFT_435667 [Hypoxylon cercidicola]|nr:hypothetical protein F4818DRAFT_435667 [Hypoxylon cercidicola]